MRVIHVTPTPFGSSGVLGGGERYPLELARALAREIECELITFDRRPGGSRRGGMARREAGGLLIRILPALAFLHGHFAHPLAATLPAALRGASVVHTHQMRSTPSRLAALVARARNQRTATTDHGLQGGEWLGLLPRLFDRFLPVSRYSATELGAPPERTRVIYGGADPDRYRPDATVRREGVLFVGRVTPHKGVDRLIEALPRGAHLRVAGSVGHDPRPPESGYPDLLRDLAAGRDVAFLGAVPDDDLPRLYRSAAVLVLPSVHHTRYGRYHRVSELLGLAVLEAMMSGTPVVASRLGGLPEIVEHGTTGYLVEPGNVAELRQRLAELLDDRGLAERMGRRAREVALARFTWSAVARRCLDAYQEMAR